MRQRPTALRNEKLSRKGADMHDNIIITRCKRRETTRWHEETISAVDGIGVVDQRYLVLADDIIRVEL